VKRKPGGNTDTFAALCCDWRCSRIYVAVQYVKCRIAQKYGR
jgi:hypothetical protein